MNKNKKLLLVSASPHLKTAQATSWIMFSVLIALLPSFVAACYYFGRRALFVTLISVSFSLGFEYLSRLLMGKLPTVSDLSCVVTGVIIAFCLPVTVPVSMVAVANFFAIVIVKQCFGGIGLNLVNPAAAALSFLMVSFNAQMTRFISPLLSFSQVIPEDAATVTTALAQLKANGQTPQNIFNLFMGNTAGNIGETSSFLLLLGGIYLSIRRISNWRIPAAFIGTVALLSLVKSFSFTFMFAQLFSGTLFLAAFFMAVDPVTTPESKYGKTVFGVVCGVITCYIRFYGTYTEGAVLAVLIANIMTPVIDSLLPIRYEGVRAEKKKKLSDFLPKRRKAQ